jgi:hypothetical protein
MSVQRTVEVAKETMELLDGLKSFLLVVQHRAKDGLDWKDDTPHIVRSAVQDLRPALNGIELIDDEARDEPEAFGNAAAIGLNSMVSSLVAGATSTDE